MLNFVLCDDNQVVLDKLSKMLESIFIQHNIDAEVVFSSVSTQDTLDYIKSHEVNVLLLDIDFKSKVSGFDVADEIRKTNKEMYIIFTSVHLEFILVAYQYKTFDFLPKPIALEKLEDTILRLMDDISNSKKKKTFLELDNKNTIINQDSIYFIKKDGMKLVFYTDTRTYETYNSFNKIEKKLPKNFVRCHKSYIANMDRIKGVEASENIISFDKNNHMFCSIGPKYKTKFMEELKNYGNIENHMDSSYNWK